MQLATANKHCCIRPGGGALACVAAVVGTDAVRRVGDVAARQCVLCRRRWWAAVRCLRGLSLELGASGDTHAGSAEVRDPLQYQLPPSAP